jgi:hypothetical protein
MWAHQSIQIGETRLKHIFASLACAIALASTASAQLSNYLGPGILTGGADTIGNRAGEQVDLRFYASLSGVYDNGIQPVSVDSKGELIQIGGLYGLDAGFGLYGVHSWRVAQLGLDYHGDFRHYTNDSSYDSTNQSLSLGYTYQRSKRLYFTLQGLAGTYSNSLGAVASDASATPTLINPQSLLLFDNRTYFFQGNAGMTYLLSSRASVTVGGDAFTVQRQSSQLVNVDGYGAHANFRYRLTRTTSLGVEYDRQHYQYPNYFGNSDMNIYSLLLTTQMGRFWTFAVSGGVDEVKAVGLETVTLSPAIAALLGVSTAVRVFSADNWIPSGRASLDRKFKNANLGVSYLRAVTPGNGVYLTSRTESATIGYTYTGVNKASFSISGSYSDLASLGQGIAPYSQYAGSAGLTYNFSHALHGIARYDVRQQEIQVAGYRRSSYSITMGIAFSPGSIPISLW